MEKRKNIIELTEKEAEEILIYCYPEKDYTFKKISFDKIINEDNTEQVTWNMKSIIGIEYFNKNLDGCILHFNNTKVVFWLYSHNYDITEFLKENEYLTDMESKYDNKMYYIYQLLQKDKIFAEDCKQNFNFDYVMNKLEEIYESYINES